MRLFLIILAIFLFIGNYEICCLVYPDDIYKWWGLKQNIYNIIIAICFYLSCNETDKKIVKFILNIGIGFVVSNCIDRIFFNVNYFTFSDYFMIIITILTSYYKVYVRKRS